MTTKHEFLSPEWVDAAREIYARHRSDAGAAAMSLRMNLVVEEVPFAEGHFDAHVDRSGGVTEVETGHIENPDLTVTLPYELAKSVFIDGNAQAGAEAFMLGLVRVQGDVTKLLAFQQQTPSTSQLALTNEIRSITT